MSEGVDFSWARPGGAAIAAAGKTFVIRYLYPDGQGGKGLDLSEVQDYRAHGLAIGAVFESSGNRALAGFAAGAADARTSVAQLAALRMSGTPVYFAVDFNATSAQNAAIGSYLDGAASVLGKDKTGLYAGYGPIDALVGVHCKYGWQTYAWSGGRLSSKAHVYQYKNGQTLGGGSVDFCRSLQADFGAFGNTSLAGETGTPITADIPPPSRTDTDMRFARVTLNASGDHYMGYLIGPNGIIDQIDNQDGWDGKTPFADNAIFARYETMYGAGLNRADYTFTPDQWAAMQARIGAWAKAAVTNMTVDNSAVLDAIKAIPAAPRTFVAQ